MYTRKMTITNGASRSAQTHPSLRPDKTPIRQLVSPRLNSRANLTDPIVVSNLDHPSGQGELSKA